MQEADVVMVAERAVNQGMKDLRGEIGVKFQEMQNGVNKFIEEINIYKSENEAALEELQLLAEDTSVEHALAELLPEDAVKIDLFLVAHFAKVCCNS